MPLKITLKPLERMVIDGAVIRNGENKTVFYVENRIPLLRQKDMLTEKEADTVCSQIYFTIQLMYLDQADAVIQHAAYWKLVHPLVEAVPSAVPLIDKISAKILEGQYYRALKLAKKLVVYEEEVMNRV